ncbi:MAG: ATP phosphoribosyltransferase [Rhodospirillales bacterium 12-54-5]|nr:MAG: ATP phosphoribosyltransferase [Rhodospirillales bacterium 12-54-5]
MNTIALTTPLTIAIPKGRIFVELAPLLKHVGIAPEPSFFDESDRALQFKTNVENLSLIRVRSFDVATFVAYGAAQLGVCGSDVIEEFSYPDLYAPLDLGIGKCRLSVAEPTDTASTDDPSQWTHVRIATKYPNITNRYFAARGVQAECIHLNGAMELAPASGLSQHIVDLVSSGATLKANRLVEVEKLLDVSSRLIVNRTAYKTRPEVSAIVNAFKGAIDAA